MSNPWVSNYKSEQGTFGLGTAIMFFTSISLTVLLPLNDTQKYDLAVDMHGELKRIQVKTTQYKAKSGNYVVLLKNSGGSSGKSITRLFDNKSCDYLFILTKSDDMYLIPSSVIKCKNALTLTEDMDKFKVKNSSPLPETVGEITFLNGEVLTDNADDNTVPSCSDQEQKGVETIQEGPKLLT